MTEELEQLLKNLKLRRLLNVYDEQLQAAEKAQASFTEFVAGLLRAQWHERQKAHSNGGFTERICPNDGRWRRSLVAPAGREPQADAHVLPNSTLWPTRKPGVGRSDRRGKTGLACGLLLKALQNGHRCQFVRAQDLFDEMYARWPTDRTRQLLNRLARLDVLLIDEFGYLNLKPEQSTPSSKLMEERYHRHSTIITTNLGYDEWQNFLGNKSMVEALLSRVRHYCHTVTINGPSLRDPQG